MALWLARAGKYGEHEQIFLKEGFTSIAWEGSFQEIDLSETTREQLRDTLEHCYPNEKRGTLKNWLGQIAIPAVVMQPGDLVVMPYKHQSAVAVGEVTSGYLYDAGAPAPYRHKRLVKWLNPAVPRSRFGQDLLYSFGAFMTFCEIRRNNAEARVRDILKNKPDAPSLDGTSEIAVPDAEEAFSNLTQTASDQLIGYIEKHFKGDRLEVLVEELFKAQGYFTYRSPRGADRGVDVLAAKGAIGFESPKICIQVKSGGLVERSVISQLQGTMTSVGADYGLLVSWDGFKSTVTKDERQSRFFQIRLWDRDDLLEQVQLYYDRFSDELKADLPLKRLWVLATGE
ncbi:MAG: restriction endonuclease [Myxacorys californica WJT36-NPBG1]|nr:restriction endonuclease [Myxacorys californica WJT36-NPBG1]